MAKIYQFIMSTDTLKELSLIENNVESGKLTVMMNRVQKTYIEPVLGTPLYKKILQDIEDESVTGIYETLIDDYLIDYFLVCAELEYIVSGSNKLMNMGSAKYNPNETSQNDLPQNNDVRDNLKRHKVAYKNTLVGWLEDNKTLIPEYEAYDCAKSEQIKPDDKSINPTFGIVTRKKY
jgi:hypothetical protein